MLYQPLILQSLAFFHKAYVKPTPRNGQDGAMPSALNLEPQVWIQFNMNENCLCLGNIYEKLAPTLNALCAWSPPASVMR